jgi:hypothetical protein
MMKPLQKILLAALVFTTACEIMPQNTLSDCREQCKDSDKPNACYDFCACIHSNCQPLDKCLAAYNKAPDETNRTP